MKILTKVIFFFIITIYCSFSQIIAPKTNQTLLKGTVTDEYTGSPVGVEIQIKGGPEGKKIVVNSNTITGNYEQLLTAGEKYTITFIGFDIMKQEVEVNVTGDKKYSEQIQNFKVKKFAPGVEIFAEDFFEGSEFNANNTKIADKGKNWLSELNIFMRINRNVELEIKVNAQDMFQFAMEKPGEPNKTTTTEPVPSKGKGKSAPKPPKKDNYLDNYNKKMAEYTIAKEQADKNAMDIAQKRANKLIELISNSAFKARIKVTADNSLQSSLQTKDTRILVLKCENKLSK